MNQDLIEGMFVRLQRENYLSRLNGGGEFIYEFVRFLGEFDGEAIVQHANGSKSVVKRDDMLIIGFEALA